MRLSYKYKPISIIDNSTNIAREGSIEALKKYDFRVSKVSFIDINNLETIISFNEFDKRYDVVFNGSDRILYIGSLLDVKYYISENYLKDKHK